MLKNILDYFDETVKKYPDKIGFSDEKREATFKEMQTNAKAIGSYLLPEGSKRPVAILIDKSCDCAAAMLGALYAGDFYVVLDVHSPVSRLNSILETLKNPLVLYRQETADTLNQISAKITPILYEDAVLAQADENALCYIRENIIDMDTAYILFTSGSTGVPKGTVISHRALISYINWVTEEFGFDENTVFGSQTPLYFSMSVTDFYSSIKCGCEYVIIPKQHFSFPINLVDFLNEKKINTIYWVPTAISILSNWKVFDVLKPEHLKTVLFAGEVMPTKQLNYWINTLPENIEYANLFGPTETTDICTFYRVDRKFGDTESLPIGKKCDNCDVFIINENGEQAKPGEEGELYCRSTFLANGYYDNPEKTAAAFVQNPLNPHFPETVYKTGDLVKENERGEIIYISRKDFQIKRSGYRIELGEIEAAANGVEKVKNCACVYNGKTETLALFYEGGPKDTAVLLDAVKSAVPYYMIPDRFERIKQMPLNANGKIDRKALILLLDNKTE